MGTKILIWLLPLALYAADEPGNPSRELRPIGPGNPSRELRQEETQGAAENYSNPTYPSNIRQDDYQKSPGSKRYFDDPNWPDIPKGK